MSDPSLAPSGMTTLYVLAPVTLYLVNADWRRGGSPADFTAPQQTGLQRV
ncbi:MAG TPA: hypothetical protein VMN36_08060 [Verrucomicrobiales bacterium]|nr:hypothetical protein [Verrucomicrobiales bacterium]